jgi:hypothetical protein
MRTVRTAGLATVVGLGLFMFVMFRRERRAARALAPAPAHSPGLAEADSLK